MKKTFAFISAVFFMLAVSGTVFSLDSKIELDKDLDTDSKTDYEVKTPDHQQELGGQSERAGHGLSIAAMRSNAVKARNRISEGKK